MDLKKIAIDKLKDRGVSIEDITEIVFNLQKKYMPDITMEQCEEAIICVLDKREVLNTILTGIAIDEGVEKNQFDSHMHKIILEDQGLYGIDEILALSIVNIYGSIALTNFGFLDQSKPGIIGKVDELGKGDSICNTFLDDIISAIAAAAMSRLAHNKNC